MVTQLDITCLRVTVSQTPHKSCALETNKGRGVCFIVDRKDKIRQMNRKPKDVLLHMLLMLGFFVVDSPMICYLPNFLLNRLFIGDLFLHDAERTRQEGTRKYYEPTTADESSRAWNRWHKKFGFANSPPHTFRSASLENLQKLSRREQEDQYLLHTYSCSACRTALRRSRLTRNVAGIVGAVAASMLMQQGGGTMASRKIRSILGMLFLGGSLLGCYISNQIVKFHEGSIRPSDTSDRGWSMYQK